MKPQYDVLIIGAGVIGSAIAREMSRYNLKIAVLEKNLDVCYETSGRNSAVIHGGFAYDPGTLKAQCCVEGNQEFDNIAAELAIPFKRTGKVLVGNTSEEMESLKRTMTTGVVNGVQGLKLIGEEELHHLVPAVVGKFALYSPCSGIVDPFLFTIGLAENAAYNGVKYFFNKEVTAIDKNTREGYIVTASGEIFTSRWIVNSSGLGCGKISSLLGISGYRVVGSKGDYIILDKRMGAYLPMPVYPVPSNTYMGVHVTPTVDGNVTVGPNAEYVDDFAYYGVPQSSIDYLAENASRLWPHIHKQDYIRNYSGILPKWVNEDGVIQDFKIEVKDDIAPHAVNLIGIESPGLTAAIPIAKRVIRLIAEREQLSLNKNFEPHRNGTIRFSEQSEAEKARLIQINSDYGEIICRCEAVTKAEILQAIHNPLGVSTMAGIKYRTRSMMGRCQGGYCQMRVAQLIQEELNKGVTDVVYARAGSNLFTGRVRK